MLFEFSLYDLDHMDEDTVLLKSLYTTSMIVTA